MSPLSVDQALWLAARQRPKHRAGRRPWTEAEHQLIKGWVGKLTLPEMAAALGRKAINVSSHLNQLGYSIRKDVYDPLGLTITAFARRMQMDQARLWVLMRGGHIKATKCDGKDFLVRWPEVRRIERQLRRHWAHRQKLIDAIGEPTISAGEFSRMIGLSNVQCSRYLQGKVVRAWKIPMPYTWTTDRDRWEWRVSKKDAERVTRQRQQGRLKLDQPAFRKLIRANTARVNQLRHERRLGRRDDLTHRLSCVVPGCYNVRQVASHVGLSETAVYEHIRTGKLKTKRVPVGTRTYVAIQPQGLADYIAWTKREKIFTGPVNGYIHQREAIKLAGRISVPDALAHYPEIDEQAFRAAIASGKIASTRVGRMIALRQQDVRAWVKLRRRWKEMRSHNA